MHVLSLSLYTNIYVVFAHNIKYIINKMTMFTLPNLLSLSVIVFWGEKGHRQSTNANYCFLFCTLLYRRGLKHLTGRRKHSKNIMTTKEEEEETKTSISALVSDCNGTPRDKRRTSGDEEHELKTIDTKRNKKRRTEVGTYRANSVSTTDEDEDEDEDTRA